MLQNGKPITEWLAIASILLLVTQKLALGGGGVSGLCSERESAVALLRVALRSVMGDRSHMRKSGNLVRIAAALAVSVLVAGCDCFTDDGTRVQSYQLAAPAARTGPVARARPQKVKATVLPKQMSPGEKLRRFCGQRHVEFQSGRLKENEAVKARNNELCRKYYQG
jgi:hypothetical protein